MTLDTFPKIQELFATAKEYIISLQKLDGTAICDSTLKTGFCGFLIAIKSFQDMFEMYVITGKLNYLLSFKFSQDHLETFFSAVRASLGFNDNPTVRQFSRIMKKLLVHNEIRGGRGQNCQDDGTPSVLMVNSTSSLKRKTIDPSPEFNTDVSALIPGFDHDYISSGLHQSKFKEAVLYYVSGFVVRKVIQKLNCDECANALTASDEESQNEALLKRKRFGNLVRASQDAFFVCKITESLISKTFKEGLPTDDFMPKFLSLVLKECFLRRP
jgi:hypothetical protein